MEFQTFQYDKLRDAGTTIVILGGTNTNVDGYRNQQTMSMEAFRKIRRTLIQNPNVDSVAWVGCFFF